MSLYLGNKEESEEGSECGKNSTPYLVSEPGISASESRELILLHRILASFRVGGMLETSSSPSSV